MLMTSTTWNQPSWMSEMSRTWSLHGRQKNLTSTSHRFILISVVQGTKSMTMLSLAWEGWEKKTLHHKREQVMPTKSGWPCASVYYAECTWCESHEHPNLRCKPSNHRDQTWKSLSIGRSTGGSRPGTSSSIAWAPVPFGRGPGPSGGPKAAHQNLD